jgi:site-specific DNA recombinase
VLNLTGLPAASVPRVSTVMQARAGTGKATQRREIADYIERHGMVLFREYEEEDGVSGRVELDRRPEIRRLMADVQAGLVKVVVVHRIDRSAREFRLVLNLIHDLEQHGAIVLSATQEFDPTTPEGRMLRNLLGIVGETDWEGIIKRLRGGREESARMGYWPGGVPPYGLRRRRTEADKHTRVVLDEGEAATARAAAALVVDDGLSDADAAARLNALGHRTRGGGRWGAKALRRVLLAPHMAGTYLWASGRRGEAQGEAVAIPVPAVLTPERQAQVRAALGPEAPAKRYRRSVYLLSGRIASPCGGRYRGRPIGKDQLRRYVCSGEAQGGGCGCARLDVERIEERVWSEVRDLLTQPERLCAMAADYLAQRGAQMGAEREQLSSVDAKITKLDRALTTTVADYMREGVPAAAVKAATDALADELAALRRHRAELARWQELNAARSRTMSRLWELAEAAHRRLGQLSDEQRATLLSMLDVQVTLTGASECHECGGVGKLNGRRGGYRCGTCRGLRTLVDLRIDGNIKDTLGDALASAPPAETAADRPEGDLVAMRAAVS